MWSGPRNLSTALMRSFENRKDTSVIDEPLYAYYLNETKKNHPLCKDIINKYETNIDKLILHITKKTNKKIIYQKHMTHHILTKTPTKWIEKGTNCFLIRDPNQVIKSYIKKNELSNSNDLGFPMQLKLFKLVKKFGVKPIIINAEDLSSNPRKVLVNLCKNLNILFSEKMLKWPKGERETDGIWEKIWYKNVKSSTNFEKINVNNSSLPNKYKNIYLECLDIYKELNKHNILNER